ncbi:hypothetical protein [Thalassotalea litorea]|uniref:hypothetical protein n=1 Tax=Thalassotalea litorea TaxID=2020715 RepID=UPI0037366041
MNSALFDIYQHYAGPMSPLGGGFFLTINAQTGIGKTYQAERTMARHLIKDSGQTVIYTTNSRENVKEAYQNVLALLANDATIEPVKKRELLNHVILLPSQETSLAQINPEQWSCLLDLIPKERKKIEQSLRQLQWFNDVQGAANKKVIEPQIRDLVQRTYSQLRHAFRYITPTTNAQKHTLNILFPANRIDPDATQVLFMTTAKLLHPWHGQKRSVRVSDLLSNSLMILDEFDRQQEEFIKHLLDKPSDFDIIELSRRIFASFDSFEIEQSSLFKGVDECFDKFRRKLGDFSKRWHVALRPSIKAAAITEDSLSEQRLFSLFSDRMSLNAANFNRDELKSNIDTDLKCHTLGEHGERRASSFINAGGQLIREFSLAMLKSVNIVRQNLVLAGNPALSSEELVVKILNSIGLKDQTHTILALLLSRLVFRVSNDSETYSFHSKGFELTNISQNNDSDDTATAKTFDLAITATGLLASWVQSGAKIVGISATADSPSVIHNFDLRYLERVLTTRFIQLNEEEKQRIQAEYLAKRRYRQCGVDIECLPISQRSDAVDIRQLYAAWQGENLEAFVIETKLAAMFNVQHARLEFTINRFNKVLDSLYRFSQHPTNRYHFCMLNITIKTDELRDFIHWYGTTINIRVFANINAASFRDGTFATVIDALETSNEKIAVITNYQATGAGISPTYALADEHDLVYVGPKDIEPLQSKGDIDSIYLEQPKNMIGALLTPEQAPEDNALARKHNIHDVLMLHEQGYLTAKDAKGMLKKCIRPQMGMNSPHVNLIRVYKDTDDYRYGVFRMVEQALGRMCRTEWKQQHITIMFDSDNEFVKLLASDKRDLSLLSHEYKALVDHARLHCPKIETKIRENSYSLKATRNFAHINRLITSVYQHQNIDAIGQYQRIREMMLRAPVLEEPPQGETARYYLHVKNNGLYRYQLLQPDDGGVLQINVDPVDVNSLREVSGSSSRLELLMRNPVVNAHFESLGYATSFASGKHVLAPAMFDIYLGALGEEAIFALVAHHGFAVSPMPAGMCEWFDGFIEVDDRILLVDAKHWDLELACLHRDDTLTRCLKKLGDVRGSKALAFEGKQIQAVYINSLYDGTTTLKASYFDSARDNALRASAIEVADIIEVPGVLNNDGQIHHSKPFQTLITYLNNCQGGKSHGA